MVTRDELLGAIHKRCMDCSGQSRNEVENCRVYDCFLYPYRSMKAIKKLETQRANQKTVPQQTSMLKALEQL